MSWSLRGLHENLDVFSYFNKKWQIFTGKEIPLDTCKKPVGSRILPWDLWASVSQHPLEVKDHFPYWFLNLQAHLRAAWSRRLFPNGTWSIFSLSLSCHAVSSLLLLAWGLSRFSYSTRVIFLQPYRGVVMHVFSFTPQVCLIELWCTNQSGPPSPTLFHGTWDCVMTRRSSQPEDGMGLGLGWLW